MRDFRDAKAMARALRDALKAKAIEITHTEALELIAKAFGYKNWNILSAKIAAAEPKPSDERFCNIVRVVDWLRKEELKEQTRQLGFDWDLLRRWLRKKGVAF
jgi:hypothetical protein